MQNVAFLLFHVIKICRRVCDQSKVDSENVDVQLSTPLNTLIQDTNAAHLKSATSLRTIVRTYRIKSREF